MSFSRTLWIDLWKVSRSQSQYSLMVNDRLGVLPGLVEAESREQARGAAVAVQKRVDVHPLELGDAPVCAFYPGLLAAIKDAGDFAPAVCAIGTKEPTGTGSPHREPITGAT